MTKKEINEIRKQFTEANCTVSRLCACYVDSGKNKVSQIREAFLSLPEADEARYFQMFKKGMSGTLGKNLLTVEFPLESEKEGGSQEFLMRLRDSKLQDEGLLEKFYDKVIDTYSSEENLLIVLADCNYDIPGKTSDGAAMEDTSEEVYHYLYCCICPVTLAKPGLTYVSGKSNFFADRSCDWVAKAPAHAFLFPAFTDRTTDIHSCLYYAKDTNDEQHYFTDTMFNWTLEIPADKQKEVFLSMVQSALGDNADMEIVKAIHENLHDIMEDHKSDEVPLALGKQDIAAVLENSGATEEQVETFTRAYENTVGTAELVATNLVADKVFEVKTADVVVKVNPERSDLVRTAMVDGRECLVIDVGAGIEVNGLLLRKGLLCRA